MKNFVKKPSRRRETHAGARDSRLSGKKGPPKGRVLVKKGQIAKER